MKLRILVFCTCLVNLQAFAQFGGTHRTPQFGNNIYFDALSDQHNALYKNTIHGIYLPDDAVFRIFDKDVSDQKLASPIALGIKLDPKAMFYGMMPVQSFNKSFPAFHIKGTLPTVIIAMGINKNNIADYRYRVVLNDSVEIVHWSPIPGLDQKYGAKQPYGFIGNFSFPGRQAFIEVVNINDYNIRSGAVLDGRSDLRPFPFGVIASAAENGPSGSPDFNVKRDSITQRVTQITCVKGTVGTINIHLRQHPGVAYGSSIDRFGPDGNPLYRGFGLDEDYSGEIKFDVDTLPAGNYRISIFPFGGGTNDIMATANQVATIDLIITASQNTPILDKKASFKQLLPYIGGAVALAGIFFGLYRRRANIRLARSVQARQNVNLKMRSIRAQLNPHFMFNALTSIQNLVNKQDMEGANHYLSRFASLTRKVLNTGEKELISLDDELKILDDYLQMEQLRFGFQYRIETGAELNMANTEVPAMLLQPFVENAVKHGVSDLRERGEINIAIRKENKNLNLIITDNGMGFKHAASDGDGSSFGLRLSKERIELLNQLYTGNPFALNISSNANGTMVTLTLTDWIS